jgi:hypothetical protein
MSAGSWINSNPASGFLAVVGAPDLMLAVEFFPRR